MSFNPEYTFENFVTGKANEFVHAACSAVANHLGNKYNPLLIHGAVGMGKTHLLQAIGQKVLLNNPDAMVCHYTSERFMEDFIDFVSRRKMTDFRVKFHNVDILLIDDIQFWAGKERTQEEFFHTFNAFYESHRQIAVTSDRFPKGICGLEERLRSRFAGGLVADIQPPDTETKRAILRKKAEEKGIKLPEAVVSCLASVIGSDIRTLESFLYRIDAVSVLTKKKITISLCQEEIIRLLKNNKNAAEAI